MLLSKAKLTALVYSWIREARARATTPTAAASAIPEPFVAVFLVRTHPFPH